MKSASVALVMSSWLLAAASGAPAQDDPNRAVENGRRVYLRTGCYQCHGRESQGSPTTGPRLGPPASAFAAFEAWVRRPRGEMPPYTRAVLSDADLADIYAFLRTRPRPAAASRLP
jgi:mono/diheme cytochrome c family protein